MEHLRMISVFKSAGVLSCLLLWPAAYGMVTYKDFEGYRQQLTHNKVWRSSRLYHLSSPQAHYLRRLAQAIEISIEKQTCPAIEDDGCAIKRATENYEIRITFADGALFTFWNWGFAQGAARPSIELDFLDEKGIMMHHEALESLFLFGFLLKEIDRRTALLMVTPKILHSRLIQVTQQSCAPRKRATAQSDGTQDEKRLIKSPLAVT